MQKPTLLILFWSFVTINPCCSIGAGIDTKSKHNQNSNFYAIEISEM